jgi:hypothetical protein
MSRSSFSFSDSYNLGLLMEMHLDVKENLTVLREAIDYEEVKGIFPGRKRNKLYERYNEKLNLLQEIEDRMLELCPPLDDMFLDKKSE